MNKLNLAKGLIIFIAGLAAGFILTSDNVYTVILEGARILNKIGVDNNGLLNLIIMVVALAALVVTLFNQHQ